MSKDDRNKASNAGSPLKCCQFNESLSSIQNEDNVAVCETDDNIVVVPQKTFMNNNTRFQNNMETKAIFSKKLEVDLKFEDITFSANVWNWKKLTAGKISLS